MLGRIAGLWRGMMRRRSGDRGVSLHGGKKKLWMVCHSDLLLLLQLGHSSFEMAQVYFGSGPGQIRAKWKQV